MSDGAARGQGRDPSKEDCDGIHHPGPRSRRARHLPPAKRQARGLLAPRGQAAPSHGWVRRRRGAVCAAGADRGDARREAAPLAAASFRDRCRLVARALRGQGRRRRASSAHARGAPLPARPPPSRAARAAGDRRDHGRRRRPPAGAPADGGLLGEDRGECARDAPDRDALRPPLRLDRRRPSRAARARRAPASGTGTPRRRSRARVAALRPHHPGVGRRPPRRAHN